ncbi:M1 family metallopeptidase [Anaerolinea thermophila]|uniref:M1 family metallopeptidase n=2 Tax=Anaerolinea TaxID=233189 RepID=UPI0026ECAB1D|nr:M1 family metallopeptidase [Anaerolinea thermophila]
MRRRLTEIQRDILTLFIAFILTLAGACAPSPTPPSSETATPLPSPTFPPSPTPTLAPTSTPETPAPIRPRYTLTAILNYPLHSLNVQERITYIHTAEETLDEVWLVVDALLYPGAFEMDSLQSIRGPALTNIRQERTWIKAELDSPLRKGETLELDLTYRLSLPARVAQEGLRPQVFGWSERQTNLVDWYAYLPPYIPGQGWLAHPPGYYGEHQVYEWSDFKVNLQITGEPENLTIAASAPESRQGEWRQYFLEGARTFALSLSPSFVHTTRQAGAVTLHSYAFPYHKTAGERVLNTAAQALDLYSRLFSPYPHEHLAVVEADFLDGMEYDGLFFLSYGFYNLDNGTPAQYLVALTAHETAHQWFYGVVGNDQALQPWLDEALCTYAEKLYYETYAPEALTWWWEARVNYYQPRGYVDDSIYNPHGEAQPYRAYRDAVYLNGAVFLEELRKQIGDEAFFDFLRMYVNENRGKIASAQDFFRILRQTTRAPLQPLLERFFQNVP